MLPLFLDLPQLSYPQILSVSFPGLLVHAIYTNSCNFYGAVLSCSHIEPVTVLKMTRHDKTNKMSVRPSKTQISLGICPVWSESWHCAQWVAKDQSFLHADSKDWSVWADAQADLSLPWAHTHFVGFVMLWLNYWSGVWKNQQDDECTKWRLKSARASTQSDHSSLCAQWVAKDPMLLHADSEDWSDWVDAQANLCLCWAHRSFCGFCHVVTQIIKDCFIFKYRE